MNVLSQKLFKAATWIDANNIVEGVLMAISTRTNEPLSENEGTNGYLLGIRTENNVIYPIAPDTLEIVENPHFSTITQLLLDNGLTTADIETFWTYSMQQAIKLCTIRNSGTVIFVNEGRSFGKTESMKRKFDELLKTAGEIMTAPTYSTNESSSKYISNPKNNFKK